MAFFNSTKTVVIMCMVIVLLLCVLLYANWDKIFPKTIAIDGTPSNGQKVITGNPADQPTE